tara:strand:+ start:99 stop:434 length:336 start_codon:yes stop_codon:yes gene_type:complete
MKNIKINKYMKNKKTLALLGCGALLLSGVYFSNSKNENTNYIEDNTRNVYGTLEENQSIIDSLIGVIFEYEVLLDIHPYFEPYSCENKIDLLQEEIMELGASLDSCIYVND